MNSPFDTPCDTPTVRIGWPSVRVRLIITQGVDDILSAVVTVQYPDGSPLPSYDGYTWRFRLLSNRTVLTVLDGACIGDPVEHTLTCLIPMPSSWTASLPAGTLTAYLEMEGVDEALQRIVEFDVEVRE